LARERARATASRTRFSDLSHLAGLSLFVGFRRECNFVR
jgi:hypothetical protein